MDKLLRCRPHFVEKVWGGRKMEALLGKDLPGGADTPIGESWEISFRADAPTPVIGGELDGRPLHELACEYPAELLGGYVVERSGTTGPLLLKIIDANTDLSVQVHPDEAYAGTHDDAEAKSEAWYVLQADPGSRLIRGVEGVDGQGFRERLEAGRLEECLHEVPVSGGEVMDLPARTIHALGSGVLIAEIQQSSDTTYRVFDWNRVGLDGEPRELHVEKALEVSEFKECGEDIVAGSPTEASPGVEVTRFIDGPRFVFERLDVSAETVLESPEDRFSMIVITGGGGELSAPGGTEEVAPGQSILVPASVGEVAVRPAGTLEMLRFYVV